MPSHRWGLRHAVVTSVNRDDRSDGGAELFAMTIRAIRARLPDCTVEVLVPDFQGSRSAMDTVLDARPNILNHNIETVPRLYRTVRVGSDYRRSLMMLRHASSARPAIPTKSGIMLGLGETDAEIYDTLGDLREHGVDILTVGQYLRPSPDHLSDSEVLHPGGVSAGSRAWLPAWFPACRIWGACAQFLPRGRGCPRAVGRRFR